MKEKLEHQIMVRLSPELLVALAKDAEKNGRTISQSVRFYLRKSLDAGVKQ